ncbi:hypothetical protein [Streptomyces sp. NPDC001536]|uniref:hypothetical protein n=1 Tax=Streptomyces sp. NPDC001536 TaxID=3364583 RepID=UPI00369689C1
MPPRTRKTATTEQTDAATADISTSGVAAEPAPEQTTEGTASASDETENKAASATDIETKVPDVAPLEPPAARLEPAPDSDTLTTAQQLLPANLEGQIVDDATGEIPSDPDGVFVTVGLYGERARCTVRLVENVGIGVYKTPTTRLLVPVGAELKTSQADRIVTRLREQLDAASAAE